MGGHAAGEVASEMAVTNLPKHLVESLSADDGDKDIESVLSESVKKTNFDIFEKSKEEDTRGMGTTLTAGMLVDDRFFYAHVGDSRGYIFRGKSIEQFKMTVIKNLHLHFGLWHPLPENQLNNSKCRL